MLYSGIDPSIIKTSFNPALTANDLDVSDIEAVYILYDMYDIPNYKKIFENVKNACLKRGLK